MIEDNKAGTHLIVDKITALKGFGGGAFERIAAELDMLMNAVNITGTHFRQFYQEAISDSIISPQEKQTLRQEFYAIEAGLPYVLQTARDNGIAETYIDNLTDAYSLLRAYLFDQLNLFDEMDRATAIDNRGDFLQKWDAYFDTLAALTYAVTNGIVSGEADVGNPSSPTNVRALAGQDEIVFSCSAPDETSGLRNIIDMYLWELKKGSGDWLPFLSTIGEYHYRFDRDVDGFPEKNTLFPWRVRVKVRNTYGQSSLFYAPSEDGAAVDVSLYKTWIPAVPLVALRASNRSLSVSIAPANDVYGHTLFDVQIAKDKTTDWSDAPTNLAEDANWNAPQSDTTLAHTYGDTVSAILAANDPNEARVGQIYRYGDFKTAWQSSDAYRETNGYAAMNAALDLEIVKGGSDRIGVIALDTAYHIRVRARNVESGNMSAYSGANNRGQPVVATATAAIDVVENAISTANIVDGAVVAEKIFVRALAAISANMGQITDGALLPLQDNYWIFSDGYYPVNPNNPDGEKAFRYKGEFRIGSANGDYLLCQYNSATGAYVISLHANRIEFTALGTVARGELYVAPLSATIDPSTSVPSSYYFRIDGNGIVRVNTATDSNNVNTGALVIEGGAGIKKNLHIGGTAKVNSAADSTSKDNGALIVEGGVGIEKNLNIGGSIYVNTDPPLPF
jgi:hypothetical protein